jgi:phosphodiesterase/alkaline phosphatase D-like protein
MLGADRSAFEASYLSERQLEWLKKELETEKDNNQPVFVFNHHPIKHTNGLPITFLGRGKWRGSVGNESDKLKSIFEKYNNVIYITGHLHYCTSQYTYEDCGAFKAVSLPTIGVINHGSFKSFTQGYVFEVFDRKIKARSRVFGDGKYTSSDISNSSFEIEL